MSSYAVNGDMLQAFYGAVQEIGKDVDPGVVTVHSGVRDEDIFGNEVESSGSQAGAVIAITPEEAPGTGTVVHSGLTAREGFLAVEELAASGKLLSMDMVEVNPILDERNKTGILAAKFVESALGKVVY